MFLTIKDILKICETCMTVQNMNSFYLDCTKCKRFKIARGGNK